MFKDTDCGQPRKEDVGKLMTLAGWVSRRRDHGNLIFIDLRDRSGMIQIVFNPKVSSSAHKIAESLRSEWVVQITGTLNRRIMGAENPNLPTGDVELNGTELTVLNRSLTPPFEVDDLSNVSEDLRLQYRYIDLRRPKMQRLLKLRHDVVKLMWDHLSDNGFVQVETPILIKSTPEGARDYIVPSRIHAGSFYALPQSPQQLKQTLMVAGVEKYFQIARCFRDEDLRSDRQPEHTQLDLEMSFVHQKDVLTVVETLYTRIFNTVRPDLVINTPFKRLTYDDAMARFGSDKPDLRFGMEIADLTDIVSESDANVFRSVASEGGEVKGFSVSGCGNYGRKQTDVLIEKAKTLGAKGLVFIGINEGKGPVDSITESDVKGPLNRFLSIEIIRDIACRTGSNRGDLILIVAGDKKKTTEILGDFRDYMGESLGLKDPNRCVFTWVTDFPLFEWNEDVQKWGAAHHVFSAPKEEDIQYIETDPGRVYAHLFDLVCNGSELGSGSIRIHDSDLQKRIFGVIGYSEEDITSRFGHLLNAFKYGAPPHGGMGLGLDRLCSLLGGESSIREVIAFPKTQSALDPMFDAPSQVSDEQLRELNLKILE